MKTSAILILIAAILCGCASDPLTGWTGDPPSDYALLVESHIPIGTPVQTAVSFLNTNGFKAHFQKDVTFHGDDKATRLVDIILCDIVDPRPPLADTEWQPVIFVVNQRVHTIRATQLVEREMHEQIAQPYK
jgi:hypothetical protein